ncbi:hypothetical protein [Falsiroseomonas sp. HW251]|uniref:hypothetical protein n=1 Tax=Falsiroseomonas sp. HW251 TaxID=3390998 RepID=UPI003D31077D
MRVIIEEDASRPGEGCARILLPGLGGRAMPNAVTFTREGFGADSLGPDGWQVAAGRIEPIEVTNEGDALVLVLGPEAAEHLETGPVRMGIPALGLDQIVIWPDIAPAVAGRRGGFGAQRRGEAQQRRVPPKATAAPPADDATVIVKPTPPVAPPPPQQERILPPEAPRPNASRLPVALLAVLVLLAGAGAGGWWFWPQIQAMVNPPAPQVAQPQPQPPAQPGDPTENATPAEIAAMRLPPERILAIAQRRGAQGRHGDALLLMELAADQQYGPALAALARLYDPATFAAGGALSAPNAVKAAELYRGAQRAGDASVAAPRDALRQRLEAASRNGDAIAALALRDFWP